MTDLLADIKSVDDYLRAFVPELTQRLTKELVPLYDPSKDSWDRRMAELKRQPFSVPESWPPCGVCLQDGNHPPVRRPACGFK